MQLQFFGFFHLQLIHHLHISIGQYDSIFGYQCYRTYDFSCFVITTFCCQISDSKTLSEDAREELFEKIDKSNDFIGWMIDIIPPTFISNKMLQRFVWDITNILGSST